MTRTQQLNEARKVNEVILAVLAQAGYSITGTFGSAHTSKGRGTGEVERYASYCVRHRAGKISLCVVYLPAGDGYSVEHDRTTEDAIRAAVRNLNLNTETQL